MKNFNFIFKGNISFGPGSKEEIYKIIVENNFKTACVVIDHALVSLTIFKDYLNSFNCKIKIIKCDISEPTYEKLEEKRVELDNEKFDVFIGIGGGSALDMAKALSVLYSNKKSAITYRGFEKFDKKIKPIIAIPTTAGTGSEITPNASFIDTNENKKMGINGELIRPAYAILDPELTLSCPLFPTLSAAVDSMVHSAEAFAAKKSNPIAKMFARNGFSLVFNNLTKLVNDLDDIELRTNVMYGSFLSAVSLMNSGTGPAAAMSYPLGVRFGVPHGIGGGIFLPHIIEYNTEKGFNDYYKLLKTKKAENEKNESNLFVELVWDVWKKLNIPQDLKEFGMGISDIPIFIKDTMDLKIALDQNPYPFDEAEIEIILKKLIVGN